MALTARPDGLLAGVVDLPAGRHTVTAGGVRRALTVRVDDEADVVAATIPNDLADPDCLDRLAGAAAAVAARTASGAPTRLAVTTGPTCAVGGADPGGWGGTVVAALDGLARRGSALAPLVVADGGARSNAVAAEVLAARPTAVVVDAAAAAEALAASPPGTPVVVALGPADAAGLVPDLVDAAGGTAPIVLAPWLLDASLLGDLAARGSSVLVAAHRDPTTRVAVDYRSAAVAEPGSPPATAAGLEGYLAAMAAVAGSPAVPAGPGLFGLSTVAILPAELAHPSEAGWAPGVALVRVA